MSIEADIVNALTALVSGRVFPDIAPEGTARPYITYQQVGGSSINFLDRTTPSKKNGRWQMNVWADTRLDAGALSRQVENTLRMAAALQTTVLEAPIATYDEETGLRGTRQDFSFWFAD